MENQPRSGSPQETLLVKKLGSFELGGRKGGPGEMRWAGQLLRPPPQLQDQDFILIVTA